MTNYTAPKYGKAVHSMGWSIYDLAMENVLLFSSIEINKSF